MTEEHLNQIPTAAAYKAGCAFVVCCPYCGAYHKHGGGSGVRVAHCSRDFRGGLSVARSYRLAPAGKAPAAMRRHIRRRRKRKDPFAFMR
jgi:hypothetical protein